MPKKSKNLKVVVLLCEGKHDVAFMRRVLLTDNYRDYQEKVNNIPAPLGLKNASKEGVSYFINKVKEYNYDSSTLRDRPLLPLILKRVHGQQSDYVFLYDMNGMNRISNYTEIISDYVGLSSKSTTNRGGGLESKLEKHKTH